MSAWYVLTSIGFYQVCVGCGNRNEFILGLPLFSNIVIKLPAVENHCYENKFFNIVGSHTDVSSSGNNYNNDDNNDDNNVDDDIDKMVCSNNNSNNNDNYNKNNQKLLTIDTIKTNNSNPKEIYIQKVLWNDCTYDCSFFPYNMLMNGGHLKVYLGLEPNKTWGGNGRKCMENYLYYEDNSDDFIDVKDEEGNSDSNVMRNINKKIKTF